MPCVFLSVRAARKGRRRAHSASVAAAARVTWQAARQSTSAGMTTQMEFTNTK